MTNIRRNTICSTSSSLSLIGAGGTGRAVSRLQRVHGERDTGVWGVLPSLPPELPRQDRTVVGPGRAPGHRRHVELSSVCECGAPVSVLEECVVSV